MSLHRFLAHLNGTLVPKLGDEAKVVRGWLVRLREQLDAVRTHPPATRADEATDYATLRALFEARPWDVKHYLDDFDRTRQPITPMLPGEHRDNVDTSHLPTNEIGALAGQIADAIGPHLPPHVPPAAPEESA